LKDITMTTMRTSAGGRKAIAQREGNKLTAYLDSVGILTIGVGHTSAAGVGFVRPGTNIRTTWSKPSRYVAGVSLYDWAAMGEKTL
jgi:GH24 family phage-related lysozyme (muramidase)